MFINFEVLEYWSVRVMFEGWMSSLDTPILQYSITPGSGHFISSLNLRFAFLLVIVALIFLSRHETRV